MKTSDAFRIRLADWETDKTALRAVREQVFVREQSVPLELEWDEFDGVSRHLLAEAEAQAIGTGRLLPDGHIGRMAVLASWRDKGVGSALLQALLDLAREAGHERAILSAQVRAMPFYRRFGFAPEGEEFLEAGIPHITMTRRL
ncbi:MAG TPA: GNAT family N-acetyltransferase [Burkholderiales bacterium]|nr:GNAT family N-acetyltransferase [Burkholderiales bacterium]